MDKIFLMKGPHLEEISSVVTSGLVVALKDKYHYNYISIRDALLGYINRMCPGPIDLEDKTIIKESEREEYVLKHKTINMETINRIIEDNKEILPQQLNPDYIETQVALDYIEPAGRDPTNDETDEIHELLIEYINLSKNDDMKLTYLHKFNEFSKKINMYKNNEFVSFLGNQLRKAKNEHIILECFFILHILILNAKKEHSQSFLERVKKEFLPLIIHHLKVGDDPFEYSYFKTVQIIDELDIHREERCEIFWNRMINIIQKVSETGITDNKLWLCINQLNRCKVRREWRKWLIRKDEYYAIKIAVMKELSPNSLL